MTWGKQVGKGFVGGGGFFGLVLVFFFLTHYSCGSGDQARDPRQTCLPLGYTPLPELSWILCF